MFVKPFLGKIFDCTGEDWVSWAKKIENWAQLFSIKVFWCLWLWCHGFARLLSWYFLRQCKVTSNDNFFILILGFMPVVGIAWTLVSCVKGSFI